MTLDNKSLKMEDDDIGFSPVRKNTPKKGRRAGNSHPTTPPDDDIGSTDDLLQSPPGKSWPASGVELSPTDDIPRPPPRSRRTGGWADEGPRSGKGKRSAGPNLIEQERFQVPEEETLDDSDNEVPVIPDLEEVQEEDLAMQVAQAPSVAVNRVATYKELDNDLFKHAAFATLDDIDLRLLTMCMSLEAEMKEPDVPWSWDLLFTEVSSDLNSEWNITNAAGERALTP